MMLSMLVAAAAATTLPMTVPGAQGDLAGTFLDAGYRMACGIGLQLLADDGPQLASGRVKARR